VVSLIKLFQIHLEFEQKVSVVASAQTSNGNTVITLPDGAAMTLLAAMRDKMGSGLSVAQIAG